MFTPFKHVSALITVIWVGSITSDPDLTNGVTRLFLRFVMNHVIIVIDDRPRPIK